MALSDASISQPWVSAHSDGFPSREANLKYDILVDAYTQWGLQAASTSLVGNLDNPWISAVDNPVEYFAALPPCFVANGALECLLDEGVELVFKMRKAGLSVEHDIAVSNAAYSLKSSSQPRN